MSTLGPHKLDEPGFIVAWHSKREFKAGKMLDQVMTFGEAKRKAEELGHDTDDTVYWAEPLPQKFAPH